MKSIFKVGLVTILLSLFACNNGDLFPEYENTNLLSAESRELSPTQWITDQTSTYMTYEEVSGTGYEPPDGHSDATVYRLEIKNLVPNGDFETSTAGTVPNGWSVVNNGGGADTLEIIDAGNLGSGVSQGLINDKTMHFAVDNAADMVIYDLRDPTYGVTDGLIGGASYLIRYDYRTSGQLFFEYNDTVSSLYFWSFYGGPNGDRPSSLTNLIEFPPSHLYGEFPDIAVGSATDYNYIFGSLNSAQSGPQEGYIDNVRLIGTDITYKLKLNLSVNDTVQPLISGTYRFSIYIKRDPSAGTGNRFQTNRVTIGIKGGGVGGEENTFDESLYSNFKTYYEGEDGADWSKWTEIKVDCFVQIPENISNSTKILELTVCPTDDQYGALNMDAGSILISSPSLIMAPNGF